MSYDKPVDLAPMPRVSRVHVHKDHIEKVKVGQHAHFAMKGTVRGINKPFDEKSEHYEVELENPETKVMRSRKENAAEMPMSDLKKEISKPKSESSEDMESGWDD